MNAKRWSLILITTVLILALALIGSSLLTGQPELAQVKPTIPATPIPTSAPTLQAPELTILASGSGVTILEYQGAGVRCIIASDGAGVDMVCQNSATVPVQPTPDGPDKHQTQPQGLEANALEFPRAGDGTPVLAG